MPLTPMEIDRRTGATDPERERHMREIDAYIARTRDEQVEPAPVRNSDTTVQNRTYTAPTPAPSQPEQTSGGTASTSPGTGGTSSGSGSSGGSGAGTSGSPLASMQQRMRQELDGLEADRNSARAELMDQFALAPTQQEKDAIARRMADIERRYQEGRQMVQLAYQDATQDVGTRVAETRSRKQSEMQQMLDMLEGSAQRTDDITSVAEGRDAAYGVGATLGGTQGADPYAAEIAALAQIEAGLSGQLNDIAVSDQQWVANLLASEAPAQQAALRRASEDRTSSAQRDHDARVQDRIAAERAQMNQLLAGLNSDFMAREGSLEQTLLEAELRQQQMAQEAALARARIAASRSGGSSSGGASGATGNPAMERALGQDLVDDWISKDLSPQQIKYRAREMGLDMDYVDVALGGDGLTNEAETADRVLLQQALRARSGR